MVNGLIAQLINKVRTTGLGVFTALTTSTKSIFTIIGYIIKNRQIAMGIDTLYIERESNLTATSGSLSGVVAKFTVTIVYIYVKVS